MAPAQKSLPLPNCWPTIPVVQDSGDIEGLTALAIWISESTDIAALRLIESTTCAKEIAFLSNQRIIEIQNEDTAMYQAASEHITIFKKQLAALPASEFESGVHETAAQIEPEITFVERDDNIYAPLESKTVEHMDSYSRLMAMAHEKRRQLQKDRQTIAFKYYNKFAKQQAPIFEEHMFRDNMTMALEGKSKDVNKITRRPLPEHLKGDNRAKHMRECKQKRALKNEAELCEMHQDFIKLYNTTTTRDKAIGTLMGLFYAGPTRAQVALLREAVEPLDKIFIDELSDFLPPSVCEDEPAWQHADEIPWFLYVYKPDHAAWNKLMHAMNGNIDYVNASIIFGGEAAITPGTNAHLALYVNQTNHTQSWGKSDVAASFLAAVVPVGVTFAHAVQICADGFSPQDLVFPLINTNARRFLGYRKILLTSSIGFVSDVANFPTNQEIFVPPGGTLYASFALGLVTGLGAVNITYGLNCYLAKATPIANIFSKPPTPAEKLITVYIKLPGGKYTPSRLTEDEGVAHLRSICEEYSAFISKSGRIVQPNDAWVEGNCLDIIGRIRGGGDAPTGVNLDMAAALTGEPSPVAPLSAGPSDSWHTTDKVLEQLRMRFLECVLTSQHDHMAGTSSNDVTTAVNVWSGMAKWDQAADSNIGRQIGLRFPLAWMGTVGANINVPEEDVDAVQEHFTKQIDALTADVLVQMGGGEGCTDADDMATQARQYVLDHWHRLKGSAAQQARMDFLKKPAPMVTVSSLRCTSIAAIRPALSQATITPTWAKLLTGMQQGDILTISQFVRINTSLIQGDAMNRVMAVDGPKYVSGNFGSFASILTKLFLYAAQLPNLVSVEQSASLFNSNVQVEKTNADGDATLAEFIRPRYPFHGLPISTVEARIIDAQTFTALRAGVGENIIVPPDWAPARWGDTVAIIPLSYDMANQPDAMTAWTLAFMEYPYKVRGYNSRSYSDDEVLTVPSDVSVNGGGCVYIAGMTEKVLFVLTNAFVRTGGTLPIRIGTTVGTNVVIDIAANGIGGTSVNITPSLDTFFNDAYSSNQMLAHLTTAMQWWHGHFGNRGDFVAALVAASCSSQWLGPLPFRVSDAPDVFGFKATGGTCAVNDPIDLNLTRFQAWQASCSNPDCLFNPSGQPSTVDALRFNLSRMPVRHIGALDNIAACDAVWGVLQFTNKDYEFPSSALALCSRLRATAQSIAVAMDYMYMTSGYPINQLVNPSIVDPISGGGARIRMLHDKLAKKLVHFIQPDAWPDKHPFIYGLYPNSLSQVAPWPYYEQFSLSVQNMVAYARMPMSFLPGAGFDAFTMPEATGIRKLDTKATVKRQTDNTLIEFTDYKLTGVNNAHAEPWKDLMCTQVVVPPLGVSRTVLKMFLSSPLDDIRIAFHLPVVPPNYSKAFAYIFNFPGVVRTPIDPGGFDFVDPVVFPALPSVNTARNQVYTLSIGQGQFQTTITRSFLQFFSKRIHHITNSTWATQQIGDQGMEQAPDVDALLGF